MGFKQIDNGLEKGDLSIVIAKLKQTIFKHADSLDEEDYELLHDIIDDLFSVSCSKEQVLKLLEICPNFNGCLQSEMTIIVQNDLCQHFIGRLIPKNNATEEEKDLFWSEITICEQDFLTFIKTS